MYSYPTRNYIQIWNYPYSRNCIWLICRIPGRQQDRSKWVHSVHFFFCSLIANRLAKKCPHMVQMFCQLLGSSKKKHNRQFSGFWSTPKRWVSASSRTNPVQISVREAFYSHFDWNGNNRNGSNSWHIGPESVPQRLQDFIKGDHTRRGTRTKVTFHFLRGRTGWSRNKNFWLDQIGTLMLTHTNCSWTSEQESLKNCLTTSHTRSPRSQKHSFKCQHFEMTSCDF